MGELVRLLAYLTAGLVLAVLSLVAGLYLLQLVAGLLASPP